MADEVGDPKYEAAIAALVEKIAPLLENHPPDIQGGVIGKLAAIWIAGSHQSGRRQVRDGLITLIDMLVPVYAANIWGGRGRKH